MKNKRLYWPFAAVSLLLTSCIYDATPNAPTAPMEDNQYTTISIVMPEETGVRAETDNGLQAEYQVTNGTLYIFLADATGSEDNFTYLTSGSITFGDWNPSVSASSNPSEITSTETKAIVEFPGFDKVALDVDLYGLVVLNQPSSGFTAPSTTFGTWKKTTVSSLQNDTYFTMTNAPTVSDNKVVTLVKLDRSKILSETAFNANVPDAAGTFYVQRGVAKVQIAMANGQTFTNFPVNSSITYENSKVDLSKWALNVTEKNAYPIQVWDSSWDLSTNPYNGTHFTSGSSFTRLMWATDPNYAADDNKGQVNNFNNTVSTWKDAGNTSNPETYDYCFENTMAHGNMYENQITQVVFQAKFKLDGTNATTFIVAGDKAVVLKPGDYDGEITAGTQLLRNVVKPTSLTEYTKALGTDAAGNTSVIVYKDGICYYKGLIRHFTDTELGDDRTKIDSSFDGTYKPADTGRYGILRNNVYQLTVNSVSGPGYATFPTPNDTDPDAADQTEKSYKLDLSVNILPWIKRSQSFDW